MTEQELLQLKARLFDKKQDCKALNCDRDCLEDENMAVYMG